MHLDFELCFLYVTPLYLSDIHLYLGVFFVSSLDIFCRKHVAAFEYSSTDLNGRYVTGNYTFSDQINFIFPNSTSV